MSDLEKVQVIASDEAVGDATESSELATGDCKATPETEKHVIECPNIGPINVFVQGTRSSSEVVILSVHDLGCNHSMYFDFIGHDAMETIRSRTVWVHVDVPGQGRDAPDLPADYEFPSMQKLGEDLIHVLDKLNIKEVVCFGEGAGANILARFAIAHQDRTLGIVLLHCTGSTASFMESFKDKIINYKLEHVGMNPTAESYLLLHRFGSSHKVSDNESLQATIGEYQTSLKRHTNAKNLKKFVQSFLKRSNIEDQAKKITCPILFVTGAKSSFCSSTRQLHQSVMRQAADKGKIDLLEISGCANVLQETPRKFIESFQYFLQGLGLVSSIPMQKRTRMQFARSASMEDYDQPMRARYQRAQSRDAADGCA